MPKDMPYDKSGGAPAKQANNMRKKATEPKGRMKQPKGSSESGAKAKYVKKEKNLENAMF